jgi:hypothetical protein
VPFLTLSLLSSCLLAAGSGVPGPGEV